MADHNDILRTSRQCHCRDVCKISLWSVEYIRNYSVLNFHRISYSIEICLVGRAPGPPVESDYITSRNIQERITDNISHSPAQHAFLVLYEASRVVALKWRFLSPSQRMQGQLVMYTLPHLVHKTSSTCHNSVVVGKCIGMGLWLPGAI